ncbi:MAG: HNH endonuclease [Rhizobiaceae bacterium]
MAAKPLPSPEVLRQLLRYEPETGKLFWRKRKVELFPSDRACNSWNARYAGQEALFKIEEYGYRRGMIFGRMHLAHRVIWAMHNDRWPAAQVDHVNGDRLDNKIENLREATPQENSCNRRSHRNGTSRFLGVYHHKVTGKWAATIASKGNVLHLGLFSSEREAAIAYDTAARDKHGAFAHLNYQEPAQ